VTCRAKAPVLMGRLVRSAVLQHPHHLQQITSFITSHHVIHYIKHHQQCRICGCLQDLGGCAVCSHPPTATAHGCRIITARAEPYEVMMTVAYCCSELHSRPIAELQRLLLKKMHDRNY